MGFRAVIIQGCYNSMGFRFAIYFYEIQVFDNSMGFRAAIILLGLTIGLL